MIKIAVILTALEVETRAVLRHLDGKYTETISGTRFFRGRFEEWDIAVAEVGAGNVAAAAISTRACEHYKPSVALFVGVAGGVKDVAIGDVVVGDKVYGYESGKDRTSGFQVRPDVMVSAHDLEQTFRAMRQDEDWKNRFNPEVKHETPALHVGPIAAGEKVVASKSSATAKLLKELFGDALAVEMEGRGFLEGTHINYPVRACVVRGISDLLSGKANADKGGSQIRAADAASAAAFELLSKTDVNPTPTNTPILSDTITSRVVELADLRALARALLDVGVPPSMAMLFPNVAPGIGKVLDEASAISRTVVESGVSNGSVMRTTMSNLVTMAERKHLITGQPGSGKSHELWRTSDQLLRAGEVIPLYLPAAQLNTWNELASLITDVAPNISLETILKEQRICIFIDGWSEFATGQYLGEKRKTVRMLSGARVVANGKFAEAGDTTFKVWSLELLSPDQVINIVKRARPGEPVLSRSLIDLLRLPLLLSIHVLSGASASTTGDLLRQFHSYLSRNLPEEFTDVLADAIAASALGNDRSYGRLRLDLQKRANLRGISEPVRLLHALGTIVERGGQALPIHDLYWSWLTGHGLMRMEFSAEAIESLHTRESYRLALQSGTRATEEHVSTAVDNDLILAAAFDASLRSQNLNPALAASIESAFRDDYLPVRSRGGLAALETTRPEYLLRALNVLSELSHAQLYVADWPKAIQLPVLFSQRAVVADWIGSDGSDIVLDAIAERGGAEWVPWLEQIAMSGKITYAQALAAALGCDSNVPAWGRQHLDKLITSEPWKLRIVASRQFNVALARQIAADYERLVETVISQGSGAWLELNRVLVACGDDGVFQSLLMRFSAMTKRPQELLGYAVVDRGSPWIAEFQKIAFATPGNSHHHRLGETLSLDINDTTARAWIKAGYDELGWRVLIARHGQSILPELIGNLPASFADLHHIPALASMRFLDKAPVSLIDELWHRIGSPMQPKAMEDVLNAVATVYPEGVASIVKFIAQQPNSLPNYHLHKAVRLYDAWRKRFGADLAIEQSTGDALPFPRWVAFYSAFHSWDDHFTPLMLSSLPDLAIEVVLRQFHGDDTKAASILKALKSVKSFHVELFDRMISSPKLTALIPDVFADAFDTFPVTALDRCISSPDINQEMLLVRLGATSNPVHRSMHAQLLQRTLAAPINLHHYRYLASMLKAHTLHDVLILLKQAIRPAQENWMWFVREVELARGERLINESGHILRKTLDSRLDS